MNRCPFSVGASVLILLITSVSVSVPLAASELDQTDREPMEQVIERYIRTHPEVIEQSLQALEAKREAEEKARQKVALGAHQAELLNDPTSPVSGNPSGDITLVEFSIIAAATVNAPPAPSRNCSRKTRGCALSTKTFPFSAKPLNSPPRPRWPPRHKASTKCSMKRCWPSKAISRKSHS